MIDSGRKRGAAPGGGAPGSEEGAPSVRRTFGTPAAWAAAGIVVALVVLVYHDVFATLWRTWGENPNYSHGYLIPPVAAFLLWYRRDAFAGARGRGSGWGLAVVAVALLGHIVSIRAGVFMTQGYSFVLLLYGLALLFFGRAATGTVWFPLGYLIFMLPVPPFLMRHLSFRLKDFAARMGASAAHTIGIPLVRTGMTIHMPGGSLRIADPCSGLRSLIALVALGALFAFLTRGPLWKRIVLFLAALPLAVFANIVRISILCVVADIWGVETATGLFHDFSGFFLFMIAFVGLAIVRAALRFGPPKEEAA